eukprot:695489_1
MPIILEEELFKFIENSRNNQSFIDFKSQTVKNKNIQHVLAQFESNNPSQETSKQIRILEDTFDRLYLFNIDKLKMYLDESQWNEIQVPLYLKDILLRHIDHHFKGQFEGQFVQDDVKQGEQDALLPNAGEVGHDIQKATARDLKQDEMKQSPWDATLTLKEVCIRLADELFADIDRITNDLRRLFQYKYGRLYHLSMISDEIFYKLLADVPKCLQSELYDIITQVRGYNVHSLPFYRYTVNPSKKRRKSTVKKLKIEDINWTMRTDQVMALLEEDMHLSKGELDEDCELMMNNFYSNLWDWFFIPRDFWTSLPYYNAFEIVRIRVRDIMKECEDKYKINKNKTMPTLPDEWVQKYDPKLSTEQLLCGGNNKQFMFDGLDWSQDTAKHIELIQAYMHKNYIGKLQLICREHAKNNDIWTQYMTDNQIPSHIRFKINFYSVRGDMQTDDIWLNDYIKNHYPSFPPQYVQQIVPPPHPIPIIDDIECKSITLNTACIHFSAQLRNKDKDRKTSSDLFIKLESVEEKETHIDTKAIQFDKNKQKYEFEVMNLDENTDYTLSINLYESSNNSELKSLHIAPIMVHFQTLSPHPIPIINGIKCKSITRSSASIHFGAKLRNKDKDTQISSDLFIKLVSVEEKEEQPNAEAIKFNKNKGKYEFKVTDLNKDTDYVMYIKLFESRNDNEVVKAMNTDAPIVRFRTLSHLPPKVFVYKSDFDRNGICYAIGSNYGQKQFSNPHTQGLVTVKSSKWCSGWKPVEQILGRVEQPFYCYSSDIQNSWFSVDFGA